MSLTLSTYLTRRRNNRRTGRPRKLDREQTHSATALGENDITRLETRAAAEERIPGCEGRAGESTCLYEAVIRRDCDKLVLVEHGVLPQQTVCSRTDLGCLAKGGEFAAQPRSVECRRYS